MGTVWGTVRAPYGALTYGTLIRHPPPDQYRFYTNLALRALGVTNAFFFPAGEKYAIVISIASRAKLVYK